ncbi:L-serine ammonia-lyase, iron-sulfur-dependent, subunit alpha [Xanthobacteraceae bacterium Astr-EGSB]|uniref:L-cysteine desulfidase family protein n=1 Tax=Astrobacterium formosum TaxID=3069710 RepID=UPI0027AE90F4|nr:L-serine ammonia-lyase, iron-sulfur-dependent, subunit alpha [Xanthobacteraceae bacterium Astr-EGSB]
MKAGQSSAPIAARTAAEVATPDHDGERVCDAFLIDLLQSEIGPAMGCTELGAAALAAAKAAEVLGTVPESLTLTVSPNFYKNGVNVGIPGTVLKGLAYAGALGALIRRSDLGLNILDGVTSHLAGEAKNLVDSGRVSAGFDPEASDPVFVKADAAGDGHAASATIRQRHSRFVDIRLDGVPQMVEATASDADTEEDSLARLAAVPVRDLIRNALALNASSLRFLLDAARINRQAALTGFDDKQSTLGPALRSAAHGSHGTIAGNVQLMTAAASEARMRGLPVPVYSLSGSGNHGITALLSVLVVAEELGADEEQLCRALALASLLAVYVKAQTGRLTSYCGCAIAPATGVAAATVYMKNGSVEAMVHAMQSVIGTFSGMLCDGAKLSCAYKVSTVAAMAVQFAELALSGAFVPNGDGIVGEEIEDTIRNLGVLNDPGMKETDRVVLSLLRAPGRAHTNGAGL